MKSLDDKARAERVVATLTRLRSVSNVGTIERELATLARGDARHERTDQSNEHHDAFIAIQALRKGLAALLPLRLPLTFKHFGRMPYPRRESGYRCSISNGIEAQTARRPADDARQHARAWRQQSRCDLPERHLPARGVDRCVGLSGRTRGAVVRPARGLRQMRQPGKQDRRAAELERTSASAERDREAVAMSRAILWDAIFAIVFFNSDGDGCAFLVGDDVT
jgi:hypothetical protein